MDFFKQNKTATIIGVIIAIILVAHHGAFRSGAHHMNYGNDQQTITVTGQSERLVVPDTASVSFSMTRKDSNLSTVSNSVNKRIQEMVKALESYGIKEKNMATTNYSVYPEYAYQRATGESTFDGYRVTQSVTLTIRDLDQVGPVMTAIASFQVDNVSGLSFYVDDDEKIKDELRSEAIEDAKQKAKVLARELGIRLDTIVGFSDNTDSGYYPQPMYRASGDTMSMGMVENAVIPVGENNLQSSISITFEIKD